MMDITQKIVRLEESREDLEQRLQADQHSPLDKLTSDQLDEVYRDLAGVRSELYHLYKHQESQMQNPENVVDDIVCCACGGNNMHAEENTNYCRSCRREMQGYQEEHEAKCDADAEYPHDLS
jgi:hypothetical protein